ncbi:MAG: SpaA isopeptide-forming pilin-related protein [Dorea sp.]|nr:SpaA isopeptide-forming pilin-related protein [Dorea sp.]
MNSTLMRHVKKILQNYRRKKTWQKVVTVMAAVVVFITTYMLILPAITMEANLVCGKEEHTHTEECYQTQPEQRELTCTKESLNIHKHTSDCYDENDVLICGYANYVVHTHDGNCFDAEGDLVCTLPEVKEHTHTDGCYNANGELICDQPEVILHDHTEECYDGAGNLICGKLETKKHQHTDDCFTVTLETKELVCEKEEHQHTDECYNVEDESDENSAVLLSDSTLPVTKISGNNTTYDPITDTFTTNVKIEFEFTAESEKPVAGMSYIYIYPSGVVVPDEVVNKGAQDLYDGDKLAGTYQFIKNDDGSFSVKVVFNEKYVNEAGNTVKGYVQFEGSFSKEDMNEKGEIVVGADDATVLVPGDEITYPSDETESYNIDVSKSGSWVQDGDKLVYTVYIRTTKGTPNPIELEDTITNLDGVTLGNPTVTIEKGTANYYYADWDKTWKPTDNNNWSEVNDITPNYENGKLAISLPKLSAEETKDSNNSDYIIGDVYKITYSYPITDQMVADVFVENKVTVTAEDEQKGQTVTDTAESSVDVNKDFSYTVDKSGAVASDKPGYIKWTVTVNNNEINIAGAKLTDEMLGLIENTANDIVVSPEEGVIVNKGENDKITDVTFNPIENGVNKNKYTITYYTPVEESWNGTTVTNKATFDPDPGNPGDEKEDSATVTVSGVKLFKTGQYNGTTDQIDWTIVVNSGNLDIAGATLTDDMFAALSENDFTIEPETGYSFTKNNVAEITGITFTAEEDGKNTHCYTIKYSTNVTENADGSSNPVTNRATLSPREGTEDEPIGSESTVTPEEVQLSKSGQDSRWNNTINWTITVNENNRNIAGAELMDDMFSQLKASEITVKDGNWQEVFADSGQYTIMTDTEGNITQITFNAIGDTTVNTNKYIITYSTKAFTEWNDKIYHNEAKLTLDGKEIDAPADVTVYGDGSVSKSAGNATISEDGKTATIPWTVTLTIPKGGLPAGTTIVDDVTKNQWGNTNTNQWMTRSQITAWATNLTWMDDNGNSVGGTNTYNPPPEQVTFLASNGKTYTYKQISEYNPPAGEGEVNFEELTYTLFTIYFTEGLIPPEGATKLTFTYSTTVDLTKTTTGGNKFYNDVQVGGKESSAEYTYYKPSIVKTDGNGSTDTTTVSNEGNLTWKVKTTVGEGNAKLTLIDTLPEGVTLESLQLTGWGNLNMELTVDGETISGTDSTNQYTVRGTYEDRVITLNILPQTEGNTIQTGAEFTLTVNCKVNDAENQDESKMLVNTAEMKLDDVAIGSSTQTQEWSYHKEEVVTKVVDKSGGWDNTNRIMNYTVILNQEGKDLLKGADTLTLVDTMTYTNQVTLQWPFSGTYSINAALIQSSVKLYQAEWDDNQGKWVAGDLVTDWSWTYEAKTSENNWESNKAINTITATGIPDGTPLMLQYSYRITCNVPDEINGQKTYFDLNFTNKATLEGTDISGEHSSSNTKWEHSSESAGVTTDKSYTFYKVEAGNYNVSLAGATFSVYKYDIKTNTYGEEPVKTYTTNDSGSFQITRQEKDASGNVPFTYDTNTLYKVTETAPPEGYKLPDEVKTFYFYFSSTEDTMNKLPEILPSDAVDLTKEAKTVYVENVKNTTEITVEKKWQDKNGDPVTHNSGSVTVNLYQKTSQSESSGGGTSGNVNVSISVMKNDTYNSAVSACTKNQSVLCRKGSKFIFTINSWGTPSLYVNNVLMEYTSRSSGDYGSTNYIYQFDISEDTIITGYAMNDNDGCVTYTYEEPTITTDLGESSGSSGDTPILEGTPYKTITLNKDNGWKCIFTGLPLTGTDKDGNAVTYYYYIEEVSVPNYNTSYDNNGGIQSGTITVTNTATDTPEYSLPETGGSGTIKYIMGGILLMLASVLLYIKQHLKEGRRKHIRR